MKFKNLPHRQKWLIQRMQNLAYAADKGGMCYGITYAGMQMFLSDDIESFNTLLFQIYAIREKKMKDEVDNAIRLRVKLYAQAKEEALNQLIKENELFAHFAKADRLTSQQEDLLFFETKKRLREKLKNLSDKEEAISFISAFFDTIELFQQGYHYPYLFEKPPSIQAAEPCFKLLQTKTLEKQNGLTEIRSFPGAYNKEQLKTYLQTFLVSAITANFRISLTFENLNHICHLGFDPINLCWVWIHANELPAVKIEMNNINSLCDLIFDAFCTKENAVFSTKVFTTGINKEKANVIVDNWHAHPNWSSIQDATPAKTKQCDSYGVSPLYMAADCRAYDYAKKLLSSGADVNQANKLNDNTPLHIAAGNDDLPMMELLIGDKANVNVANKKGSTPLHFAAEVGSLTATKMLIAEGADINQQTKKGCTPFYYSVQNKLEVVQEFLKHPINIETPYKTHRQHLINFAKKCKYSELEALFKRSIPCFLQHFFVPNTAAELTPLHNAIIHGNYQIVELLIEKGADINKKILGVNAIELAYALGRERIASKLLLTHFDLLKSPDSKYKPDQFEQHIKKFDYKYKVKIYNYLKEKKEFLCAIYGESFIHNMLYKISSLLLGDFERSYTKNHLFSFVTHIGRSTFANKVFSKEFHGIEEAVEFANKNSSNDAEIKDLKLIKLTN